jgi:hypothetical protein
MSAIPRGSRSSVPVKLVPIRRTSLQIPILALAIGFASACTFAVAPETVRLTSFMQVARGFETCELPGLYIDEYGAGPGNTYLERIEVKACGQSEEIAYFCVDEDFHGLRVEKIAVPRSTLPVFALYLSSDFATARSILHAGLGTDFVLSQASARGEQPELVVDPDDPEKSILICTKDF